MKKLGSVDRPLAVIVTLLVVAGFFIFSSATLGLLARGTISVSHVVTTHLLLGLCMGTIGLLVLSRIDYHRWVPFAPYLFGAALIATALVFVPGLGFSSGGATRWLHIGPLSVQPSEGLKLMTIIFFATIMSQYHKRLGEWTWGTGILAGTLALPGVILLLQPDTDTYGVIVLAILAMFFVGGGRLKHLLVIGLAGLLVLSGLVLSRDYLQARLMTFIHPDRDQQGSGYQVRQSLIAIGSGGVWGRGFGQSIQKFEYLPEPVNDSIFAVAAEEFGFWGASGIVLLFTALALRGLWIAARAPDLLGGLMAVGIVVMIVSQSFFNIASMLGLIPLTGIPLVFISQGGTALFAALAASGLLLGISRRIRTKAR